MIKYMFLYFQHREGSSAAAVYKCMVSFAHSSTQSSPLVVGSLSKQTALLLHQERAGLKACGFCGRLSYGHNPGQLPVKRHIHLYPAPVPTVRATDHKPHQSVCQLETQQDRIPHGWDPPIHPVSVFYAQIKKKRERETEMETELCYYGGMWRPLAHHHSLKPASFLWAPSVRFISQLDPAFLVHTLPRWKVGLASPSSVFHPSFPDKSQSEERQKSRLRTSETDRNQSTRTDSSPKSRARRMCAGLMRAWDCFVSALPISVGGRGMLRGKHFVVATLW